MTIEIERFPNRNSTARRLSGRLRFLENGAIQTEGQLKRLILCALLFRAPLERAPL